MRDFFVIVIAGPTGTGKTTVSKLLSVHYKCACISEDELAREIFTNTYQCIEESTDEVKAIETHLLKRAKRICRSGNSAVIDRINMGRGFIEKSQKAFGKHFILKVLWPSVETTVERDKGRDGWTSGENAVKRYFREYEALKPIIGEKNYIDNSHQTPEETFENLLAEVDVLRFKTNLT
jgi:adenylate kinase family enzyme